MKILLDACMWNGAALDLRAAGHDVIWAGDSQPDPGDDELLSIALAELRVLITLDKDFGELAIVRGRRHAGIVRLVGFRATLQGSVCRLILERYAEELLKGALLTVQPGRVRIRLADQDVE